jgi:hypothetical protein
MARPTSSVAFLLKPRDQANIVLQSRYTHLPHTSRSGDIKLVGTDKEDATELTGESAVQQLKACTSQEIARSDPACLAPGTQTRADRTQSDRHVCLPDGFEMASRERRRDLPDPSMRENLPRHTRKRPELDIEVSPSG